MPEADSIMEDLLQDAQTSEHAEFGLSREQRERLSMIVDSACNGKNRATLAVTKTLLLKKVMQPEQDIRRHQAGMNGGFSGRSLDERTVTPFLMKQTFPHMKSGSGWLTRSLEQAHPYDEHYPGKIRPVELRGAFLGAVAKVEGGAADARACLLYLLRRLSDWRARHASVILAKPMGKRIAEIVGLVERHWSGPDPGVAKLPVLATYAAYRCLLADVRKYEQSQLMELLSHTSADTRTNRLGDVEVQDRNGKTTEAVEVKHNIPITTALIEGLREKIAASSIETYYILSTHEQIAPEELSAITDLLLLIRQSYGCQVIVNGVASTLRYYLRLMADTDRFVIEYVRLLESDTEISFDLKRRWNEVVG